MEMHLGPQHLLEPIVKEVYDLRKKTYTFKRKPSGPGFVSHDLREYVLGASVRSRRTREERKERFPREFWSGEL